MPNETVETYTNVYARWFAIISQFIVTASLCTLWRLQMTRYSQVLVHSTVINSRLSHHYMSISPFLWGFTAGFLELFWGFLQFQLLFAGSLLAFFWLLGWVWELFWGFLQFQLLFLGFSPALWLGLGCCFWVFCSFSYFFSAFLRLYGWVREAVLGFFAVSATFCRVFSGFTAGFLELFWGFLQFQLLFAGSFPAFGLGLGCCFGDFCSFSYFLWGFWHNGGSPTP